MCGICGIVRQDGSVTIEEINKFSNYLNHRGPDGGGAWLNYNSKVGLGHRRLSIIDVSDFGRQPMISADRRHVIVFNGEIHNFLELKMELISKGNLFYTDTDTEVILAAYAEWGVEMLNKLNGMWAFALYNTESNSLFICRDRYGIKPVYYYFKHNKFVFASEVTAIQKFFNNELELNDSIIKTLLNGSGSYQGGDETHFTDIKSLPAAHFLKLKNGVITIEKWYDIPLVKITDYSFKKEAEHLKELIYDSCKLRLRSDVSVGTCLSGGLDSGSIAAIISKYNINENERFSKFSHKSFCATFPGTPIDEGDDAKRLAEQLNLEFERVIIDIPSIQELEEAMAACDGPQYAISFFPVWKLYQYIKKKGISVTLDGQGPDELFGGYNFAYNAFIAAWEKKDPVWLYDVYQTYSSLGESSQISSKLDVQSQWRRFLAEKNNEIITRVKDPIKNILRRANLYNKKPINRIYNKKTSLMQGGNMQNEFNRHLYNVFQNTQLPAILNQYDRCSMAHGVECRTPFLDHRIVELAFSLPEKAKLGRGYTKRILREAMKGVLPDATRLNKRKLGFTAPMVDWFKRGHLRDWMLDQMASRDFINSIYFDGKMIRKQYLDYLDSDNESWSYPWKFWPPVHLTWWLNHFNANFE